jgi:thiamine-phosphate pyrophosphorylase
VIRIQITNGTALRDEARWLAGLRDDVDFIQVRERDASAKDLSRLVRAAMTRAPVLVNDRTDVAIACGASGVHLRARSVTPAQVKRLGSLIVTVACHNLEDVEAADGADYAILAPVFPPLSKSDSGKTLGLEGLKSICAQSRIPVIALGGITAANTPGCIEAGAAGVAGITLFREQP